jgi:hypothetical protein
MVLTPQMSETYPLQREFRIPIAPASSHQTQQIQVTSHRGVQHCHRQLEPEEHQRNDRIRKIWNMTLRTRQSRRRRKSALALEGDWKAVIGPGMQVWKWK